MYHISGACLQGEHNSDDDSDGNNDDDNDDDSDGAGDIEGKLFTCMHGVFPNVNINLGGLLLMNINHLVCM